MLFYNHKFSSPLLVGSSLYPSLEIMSKAIETSNAGAITMSIRRENNNNKLGQIFWQHIKRLNKPLLPNTAGCKSVKEAVLTAKLARELLGTDWIKLEIIHDDWFLYPNVIKTAEAARILNEEGFKVFPYTTCDISLGETLLKYGCEVLMPLASPIGSGQGIRHPEQLVSYRKAFPDVPIIIDAGIGSPSDALKAMELGFDGILLNSAIAKAKNCIKMARAFKEAIEIAPLVKQAGLIETQELGSPSSPSHNLMKY